MIPMTFLPFANSSSNKLLNAYALLQKLPGGLSLLSRYICRVAPYFQSVNPTIERLENGYCQAVMSKRWKVENHIGTVHVIAICNGLEFVMGVLAEASIPAHLRWIPKAMHVEYVAKADSDVQLIAYADPDVWKPGDVKINIQALRADGQAVVIGYISLWVSEKPNQ